MDLAPGTMQTRQWIIYAYQEWRVVLRKRWGDREEAVEDRTTLLAIDYKGFCNKYPKVVRVFVFRLSMVLFPLFQSFPYLLASENRTRITKNNATSMMMHPNSQNYQALKIAI